MNNTKINGEPQSVEIVGGMKESAVNIFDKVKTPVFWVAVGYVICKVMDRKKIKVM